MKLLFTNVIWGMVVACGAASGCEGRPLMAGAPLPVGTGDPTTPTTGTTPPTTAPTVPVEMSEIEQSLLARWNTVASAPVDGFDFLWSRFNQFPHPTFKGGTAEAYQAFAKVLLAFFDHGDNFDFLAQNHLFT